MTAARRQNMLYLALCLAVIVASIMGYRSTHPQWLLYRQAEGLLAGGDTAAAGRAYSEAVQAGIVLDGDLERLGNSFMVSGDLIHILPALRAWLAQRPGNREGRLKLAVLLAYDGRFEESLVQLNAALRDQPGWRTALSTKARILTWSGRREEAIMTYRKLLGETP